jgi:chaperonin GroEL (HSP60 family)
VTTQITPAGSEALSNTRAGIAVADVVRSTLGPTGLDKMLLHPDRMTIVTNDGASIIKELELDHPISDLFLQVALAQETDIGDGTTTAAVLTGALLRQAEPLVEQGVHPITIADGYTRAGGIAVDRILELSREVTAADDELLVQVAETCVGGKGPAGEDVLPELVVEAVRSVADEEGIVDESRILTERIKGEPVEESGTLEGFVYDPNGIEALHEGMPLVVEDAAVAVLNKKLEPGEVRTARDWELVVERPEDLVQQQVRTEQLVDAFVEAGVDVVVSGETISERIRSGFAEADILAFRRVNVEDLEHARRTTGAATISTPRELDEESLGRARRVQLSYLGNERFIIFEGEADPGIVTLVLRGSTKHVVDEHFRAVQDCIGAVQTALKNGRVVPGGGATEVAAARALREQSAAAPGRQQLALDAFADALEAIPLTLIENTGEKPLDGLLELRRRHEEGNHAVGFEAHTSAYIDMYEAGVLDPSAVKETAIATAIEAAASILRVDAVIPASSDENGAA